MIRNDELQAALISLLKANTTITNELVDLNGVSVIEEIREDQWQGTEFSYPNIRVKLIGTNPVGDKDCAIVNFSVSFQVYSESANSLQSDKIAGIINNELHGKQFNTNGIAVSFRLTNLIPAVRSDKYTWRSEALMSGIAS
jgi:hypothetical protein